MQRKTHRKLLIASIGLIAVGLMVLMMQLKPEPGKKDKEDIKVLVDVMRLEESTAVFEIRSQGTVQPRTQTVLSAEVSGSIVSISPKFVAGGVFQKDEQLMRIDPTNYAVAVDRAKAMLVQRQIEFDGATKLRTQGYRAESEYASAATALATAKAELVRAEHNLDRTYIRVPFEGMVKTKEADLGQFVNTGSRLGLVFATDFAEVRLPLTDQDLAFVELPSAGDITKTGEAAGPHVKLTAVQKGQLATWDAQIVRSEGTVDELSRVTYAVARVDDPYRLHQTGVSLPFGTFVGASIVGNTVANVIRVPRSTVRGANELIFIDDNNQLEIRSVQLIRTDGDYAFIGGGAEAGERIMLSAIEAPSNGMLVRTTDRPEPGSNPEGVGEQVAAKNSGREE